VIEFHPMSIFQPALPISPFSDIVIQRWARPRQNRRRVSGQAARDPVTVGMTEDVHRAALESLKNSGNAEARS
jgi:hypothetical protein